MIWDTLFGEFDWNLGIFSRLGVMKNLDVLIGRFPTYPFSESFTKQPSTDPTLP
jgi:hypothetical protein